jgi:hypothetical protein
MITIDYTDTCQPDYFQGSNKLTFYIQPSFNGYTSKELRDEILSEFNQNAFNCGRYQLWDCDVETDIKVLKQLKACLNREIKYKGKEHSIKVYAKEQNIKPSEIDDIESWPVLHIIFDIDFLN